MARKKTPQMPATAEEVRTSKPVRLDVPAEDYDRLAAAAKKLGLSMSGYARMALFERLARDESK